MEESKRNKPEKMKKTTLTSEVGFFIGEIFDVMYAEDVYEKWSKNLKRFTGEHKLRGERFVTALNTNISVTSFDTTYVAYTPCVIPFELAREDVKELKEQGKNAYEITFFKGTEATVCCTRNYISVEVNGAKKTILINSLGVQECYEQERSE